MTKSGNSKSEADPIGKGLIIFILILHAYSDSKQLRNYFAEVGTKPGKLLQRRNTLEPAKLKVFTVSLTLPKLSKYYCTTDKFSSSSFIYGHNNNITCGPRVFLRFFFYTHDIKKKRDYISTTKSKAYCALCFSSSGWQRGLVLDHRRLGRRHHVYRRRGCRRA